jgi:hypothetical protein
VAAEAPGAVRSRQGVGVEPFARRRPAAVVAVPDTVLTGDAGFLLGHGDVDRYDTFKEILGRRRRDEESAQQSRRESAVFHKFSFFGGLERGAALGMFPQCGWATWR